MAFVCESNAFVVEKYEILFNENVDLNTIMIECFLRRAPFIQRKKSTLHNGLHQIHELLEFGPRSNAVFPAAFAFQLFKRVKRVKPCGLTSSLLLFHAAAFFSRIHSEEQLKKGSTKVCP